jgi:dolichol kinase
VEANLGSQALWAQEQVRAILRDADPKVWSAEKAEDLRRRVRELAARFRSESAEALGGTPAFGELRERLQRVVVAMERALPDESTRGRWAAFAGAVHPEYEALVAVLPGSEAAPARRPTNYARSAVHFTSASVGVISVALLPTRGALLWIAGTFAVYAWTTETLRRVSPRFNERVMRFYGPIAHAEEYYRINSATWYATALVLLALFATRPGMMAGLAVLGVADPIAAFVGRRWGRHKIRAGRSLEGTLAFLGTAAVAGCLGLALGGIHAPMELGAMTALAAVTGALAELMAREIDDNMMIPLAVGAAVTAATALGL